MIIYRKKESASDTILEDMRRVTREARETIAMLKGIENAEEDQTHQTGSEAVLARREKGKEVWKFR